MDPRQAKQVWKVLVDAYGNTVECDPYGLTGDPNKTIDAAVQQGAEIEELREVLAVIANIKAHDGRISRSNREWLSSHIKATSDDWYMEYGRVMGHLDDIHTAHLNNLIDVIRQR